MAAALLLAPLLFGADATGIWTGTMTDRNGDPQDLSFQFSRTGASLSGKMYGDNESIPVINAKIAGDQITFSVTTELNGQISTFLYTGIIAGDQMDVSRIRQDVKLPEAKAADGKAAAAGKPNAPQTFRLKRLT
ncbi:MAG: hypothetical protein ABUS51_07270 [Acidobacteriota bacterium]